MKTSAYPPSNIQDILIVFDARTIIDSYQTPSMDPEKPTLIEKPENVIFILTKKGTEFCGYQGGSLEFSARPADRIKLREITLTRNTGLNVQLYKYISNSKSDLITTPTMQTYTYTIPVPNPSAPLQPTSFQDITEYSWIATIATAGIVTYDSSFVIMNRSGQIKGYFHFNFSLTITAPAIESSLL
jgi:hypothetical protein